MHLIIKVTSSLSVYNTASFVHDAKFTLVYNKLRTNVVHNSITNSSDILLSYPPDSHLGSDDVY